jgi:hypothetical protein
LSRKIAECRRGLAHGVTMGRAIELWTEAVAACPESEDARQAVAVRMGQHAPGGLRQRSRAALITYHQTGAAIRNRGVTVRLMAAI